MLCVVGIGRICNGWDNRCDNTRKDILSDSQHLRAYHEKKKGK